MSITNIERMVEALVRDEMNAVRQMDLEEMTEYVENLLRRMLETCDNDTIIEMYEDIA